ncbi:hypothetical protein V8G54_024105 [Vigna mungo]|uniref:C2H2-type domain-containing protein n=1 Tax=Vigna mungo TaxID=3915 RepID=A0AAQ3N5C9_VIGMU
MAESKANVTKHEATRYIRQKASLGKGMKEDSDCAEEAEKNDSVNGRGGVEGEEILRSTSMHGVRQEVLVVEGTLRAHAMDQPSAQRKKTSSSTTGTTTTTATIDDNDNEPGRPGANSNNNREKGKEKEEEVQQWQFECSSCNRVFGSHQALRGHRASHKNVKGCFANIGSNVSIGLGIGSSGKCEEENVNMNMSDDGHKCSICLRVFSTGQALGGHKRCHWENQKGENLLLLDSPKSSLDLNSPPLTLDLRLGL